VYKFGFFPQSFFFSRGFYCHLVLKKGSASIEEEHAELEL